MKNYITSAAQSGSGYPTAFLQELPQAQSTNIGVEASFNPAKNSVIFVDVEGTLVGADNTLNKALLEALRGQTVYLLTSMDISEVTQKAADPDYLTRHELIRSMQQSYSINVLKVITPVDLYPGLTPGQGYTEMIEPWVKAAIEGKLTEEMFLSPSDKHGEVFEKYQQAAHHFEEKFRSVTVRLQSDPKGALVEKMLSAPENVGAQMVYVLDDRENCLSVIKSTCDEMQKACIALQVNMKAKPSQSKGDYIIALNARPVILTEKQPPQPFSGFWSESAPQTMRTPSQAQSADVALATRFIPAKNSAIFVDIDGTLISSGDNTLNKALLETLEGKGVYLLTNMDMSDVKQKAADPDYLTRHELIQIMRQSYNINVLKVITPVDLHPDLAPGQGYAKMIEPWVKATIEGKMTEEMFLSPSHKHGEVFEKYQQAAHHFEEKFRSATVGLQSDPKGALVEKMLSAPENLDIQTVYVLDDRESCLSAVKSTCDEMQKACVTLPVNMKAKPPQSKDDYLVVLNTQPVISAHVAKPAFG
ncbi:MAG: hypothetical protein K0S08_292 [Gammaproteobacteria bacterium]|jgi:hypothetical protein|nr:hypothetical protein [Gammaproteobacteria bacterium]